MRRVRLAVCLAAVAVTTAVSFARASHCTSNIAVYSYVDRQLGVDAGWQPTCPVTTSHATPAPFILPGAYAISVSYFIDWGPGVPTLTATLDGAGFSGRLLTLSRTGDSLSAPYESQLITLPETSTSSWILRVALPLPNNTIARTSYFTVRGFVNEVL